VRRRLLHLVPVMLLSLMSGCGSLLSSVGMQPITEEPRARTLGRLVEDGNIETKATVNIHAADPAFRQAHVVVVSFNGYVLLAGQVASEALRDRATAVVREIRGVRRIYNELEIAAPSAAITRTSDTWITAKAKSWLLGRDDTAGTRVKVVTENGVVYLMGLATAAEAELITSAVAGLSGVQRVVKLFEIVK